MRVRSSQAIAMGLLASTCIFPVSHVSAQTAAASAASGGVEEIVVTARKRSEKLQDIPLAVTALTFQTLEKVGATDLRDILGQTAGVTLYGTGAEAFESPVIRGQFDFNYTPLSGGQPNVATFLDGVYLQNSSAVSIGLLGLERVEVIKGPVSALYGRNGFSGAINYVSKTPKDKFEADANLSFGEYGTRTIAGYLSGPVIPGILKLGFGYSYSNSDGGYKDSVTGNRAGGFEKKDLKFSLDFTPTDLLEITGGYYYGDDHFDQAALVYGNKNCIANTYYCGQFKANPIEVSSIPASSGNSGNNREVQAGHIKVNYDLGFGDISYVGGYNKVTSRSYEDFTAQRYGLNYLLSPGPGSVNVYELFGGDNNTEDSSHEIRIATKQDERLRASAGVDYFQSRLSATTLIGEDGAQIPAGQSISSAANFFLAGLFVTPTGQPSTTNFTQGRINERTYSAFGSVEYDITDQLTVSGEFRDTLDRQTLDILRNSFATNVLRPYGFIPGAGFHYNNYRTGLKYKFNDTTMAYFTVATGTKAGGFNTQSQLKTNQSYGPETNTTYEGGIKTSLFQNKLQLDASVYHIDSQNLQLYFPAGNGINSVIQNIGGTSNTGFELSSIFQPIPDLTLSASFAYTDPTFTSNSLDASDAATCAALVSCASRVSTVNIGGVATKVANLGGLSLPASSKYTVNVGADYTHPIVDDYDGFIHIDYRYQSKQFTTIDNINTSYTSAINIVNMRIGVTKGPYTVAVYGQNLLDDETPLAVSKNTELNNLQPIFIGSLPNPRTFGASFTYHFLGGSEAAASAVTYTPPPVQAVAPAKAPRSYLVFFDFNKSDLTSQAVSIVDTAAKNAGPAKVTQIEVTGHTDTVGSDAYNMRLSRRRAEAVAKQLEKDGIPSSEIAIFAKGKKDLLVPTADGVREPQNRRVQIVYEGGPNS